MSFTCWGTFTILTNLRFLCKLIEISIVILVDIYFLAGTNICGLPHRFSASSSVSAFCDSSSCVVSICGFVESVAAPCYLGLPLFSVHFIASLRYSVTCTLLLWFCCLWTVLPATSRLHWIAHRCLVPALLATSCYNCCLWLLSASAASSQHYFYPLRLLLCLSSLWLLIALLLRQQIALPEWRQTALPLWRQAAIPLWLLTALPSAAAACCILFAGFSRITFCLLCTTTAHCRRCLLHIVCCFATHCVMFCRALPIVHCRCDCCLLRNAVLLRSYCKKSISQLHNGSLVTIGLRGGVFHFFFKTIFSFKKSNQTQAELKPNRIKNKKLLNWIVISI